MGGEEGGGEWVLAGEVAGTGRVPARFRPRRAEGAERNAGAVVLFPGERHGAASVSRRRDRGPPWGRAAGEPRCACGPAGERDRRGGGGEGGGKKDGKAPC